MEFYEDFYFDLGKYYIIEIDKGIYLGIMNNLYDFNLRNTVKL